MAPIVAPLINEVVSKPLEIVQDFFSKSSGSSASDKDWGEQSYFQNVLLEGDNLEKIPYVTAENLKFGKLAPNSLVRFRGMVQETFDPEFYLGVYEKLNKTTGVKSVLTSKYTDALYNTSPDEEVNWEGGACQTMSRTPLYCVPVPAESEWSRASYLGATPAPSSAASAPAPSGAVRSSKRLREEGETDNDAGVKADEGAAAARRRVENENGVSSSSSTGSGAGAEASDSTPAAEPMSALNLPLESETQPPCLVKLYGGAVPLVNEVVEVVGVLALDPALARFRSGGDAAAPTAAAAAAQGTGVEGGGGGMEMEEEAAHQPPPSLVPRLHCLFLRRLGDSHPLLPPPFGPAAAAGAPTEGEAATRASNLLATALRTPTPPAPLPPSPVASAAPSDQPPAPPAAASAAAAAAEAACEAAAAPLRQELLQFLARSVGGDALAAEYLLLWLIARVHARVGTQPLGALSLNLTLPPPPAAAAAAAVDGGAAAVAGGGGWSALGEALWRAVGALTPRCAMLPLTIPSLNSQTFVPAKDYTANRLRSGCLQLPPGTRVVVDETQMRAGQLQARGVENLRQLQRVASEQTVSYDFRFYACDFTTDLPLLLLSRGKSVVAADIRLPLQLAPLHAEAACGPVNPESASAAAVAAVAPDEWLARARAFLAASSKRAFTISPEAGERAEAEFVAARRANPGLDPAVFHGWLTLARLVALSSGAQTLRLEHWTRMRELEQAREQRLPLDQPTPQQRQPQQLQQPGQQAGVPSPEPSPTAINQA